ncbi:carbohydrate kinase family protein [Candidatus Woesearchaeota archaeon]|nr:carbohydrate kinase family protein [Candidatus Woesearchaeota archaeon]
MFDVITIGSATVDVFATIPKKFKQIKLGDKVLITDLKFETGGGGLNSAVALRKMGLRTAFLGKIGHDHNAFKVLHELKKEKVEVIKTAPAEERTSYSFIQQSTKERDRVIYTFKGASDHLSTKEIDLKKLKTKSIYMATMLKQSFTTCEKIAQFAKKNNINLLFNPSTYLAAQGKTKLKKILDAATILVLNKSEAKLLLKTKNNNIDFLLKSLKRLGPKIIVITEGPKGMHAYNGTYSYSMQAYKVNVVSVAGAGDAFSSGFLAGIHKKQDISHALELGMANAASVIQYYGTKNKLLTYKEALQFIKKHKKKIIKKRL